MTYRFLNKSELEMLVGTHVKFLNFVNDEMTGEVTKSKNGKYWLPSCGGVNAETVVVVGIKNTNHEKINKKN